MKFTTETNRIVNTIMQNSDLSRKGAFFAMKIVETPVFASFILTLFAGKTTTVYYSNERGEAVSRKVTSIANAVKNGLHMPQAGRKYGLFTFFCMDTKTVWDMQVKDFVGYEL